MQRTNEINRKTNLPIPDIRSYRTGKSLKAKDGFTCWRQFESGPLDVQHDKGQRHKPQQSHTRAEDGLYK